MRRNIQQNAVVINAKQTSNSLPVSFFPNNVYKINKEERMRMACIIMAMAFGLSLNAKEPVVPPFTDLVKFKWKTYIGNTTYRTNMVQYGGQLIIGSNGHNYKDYAIDSDNGVYLLDARTGKQSLHLAYDSYGDMDVNGIAIDGGRIYFGSDNDEFHCFGVSGNLIWSVPVSGDVEVAPVLVDVNGDGQKDAVFVTESGEVAALDAIDGKHLWSFKIKDFSGWKKTQNRFVFKVGDWFRNGMGFMCVPLVVDLNDDGTQDIVAAARDGYIYALDGRSGRQLWRNEHAGYLTIRPILMQVNGEPRIYYITEGDETDNWQKHLVCAKANGQIVFNSNGINGVQEGFNPVVFGNELVIAGWDTIYAVNVYSGAFRKGKIDREVKSYSYKYITAKPLLLDLLGLGAPQLILLGQNGKITFMDWKNLVRLREYQLPSGTEASPMLADIDCDGKLDLLISCYDGYLYCYGTTFSEKALVFAQK
jgi:outer membrane protein assembly factor BamB